MTRIRCGAPGCDKEVEFEGIAPPPPWIFVVAAVYACSDAHTDTAAQAFFNQQGATSGWIGDSGRAG